MTGPLGADPDDPGWFSPKLFLWMLVPPLGMARARAEVRNPLHQLRLLFVAFSNAILLIGVVTAVLAAGDDGRDLQSNRLVTLGVVVAGVATLILPLVFDRQLDCSSPQALMSTYSTRFFLRIAFAEAAAMIGFVAFFLTGEAWHYPLGAAFTVIGFAKVAPTSRNLSRLQDSLTMQGCGLSLVQVLTRGPSTP